MLRLLLLASVICLPIYETYAYECGVVAPRGQQRFRRVVGWPSEEANWPFLAYLDRHIYKQECNGTFGAADVLDGLHCTASIISDEYILTAAHCLYESSYFGPPATPVNFSVVVGSVSKDSEKVRTVKLAEIVEHPSYNVHNHLNDIAVLKLAEPLQFSSTIQPICVTSSFNETEGEIGFVAGWGKHYENDTFQQNDGRLRENIVPFADPKYCQAAWRYPGITMNVLEETQMCAGGRGRDTAGGDSGGPLMINRRGVWYQVGVTSYGPKGDDAWRADTVPGVYTRVSAYCDFIKSATDGTVFCAS